MDGWTEYLKFLAAMISISNPIGVIPIFVTLTGGQTRREQHVTARRTCLAFGIVLLVILVAGEPILRFFGITIASFKVAGGIIILLMAIAMVHGRVSGAKHTKEESEDAADKDSLAIVPLAIPLLAGPGAISTVIVYSNQGSTFMHYLILGGELMAVALLTLALSDRRAVSGKTPWANWHQHRHAHYGPDPGSHRCGVHSTRTHRALSRAGPFNDAMTGRGRVGTRT